MSEGYIYCFSNPLFSNLLKIGMTERTPEERLHEANACTWIHQPFELKLSKKVNNARHTERKLHILLQRYNMRVNNSREFFEISTDDIKLFFDLIDGEYYNSENELVVNLNSSLSDIFHDGQRIRHKARCTEDIWYAVYNQNVFIYNEIEYRSLSAFAGAHYAEVRPDRGTSVNGWDECEVEIENGQWVIASTFTN